MATITANISASESLIRVSEPLGVGHYTIGSEAVYVRGMTSDRALQAAVDRGIAGTTAASHSSGATLTRYYPDAATSPGEGSGGVTVDNGTDPPVAVRSIVAPGATFDGDEATLVAGLPIADGIGTLEAALVVTPAAPSGTNAAFAIVPAAGASDSDVMFVVIDPGGDPLDQFGIFEILVGGTVLLGQGGQYPIQFDGESGDISAKSLGISSGANGSSLDVQGRTGANVLLSRLTLQGDRTDVDDGALIYKGGPSPGTVHVKFMPTGAVLMRNLPTADPQVFGSLWVDTAADFVIKQSQG